MQDYESFTVDVIAETDKALLCVFDTGDEKWVPRSQMSEDSEVDGKGDSGLLEVTLWWAEKAELV